MMPAGKSIVEIEKGIDRDLKPNSFDLSGWTVSMEVSRNNQMIPLKNVIGVLEGNGPLAKETVVVAPITTISVTEGRAAWRRRRARNPPRGRRQCLRNHRDDGACSAFRRHPKQTR